MSHSHRICFGSQYTCTMRKTSWKITKCYVVSMLMYQFELFDEISCASIAAMHEDRIKCQDCFQTHLLNLRVEFVIKFNLISKPFEFWNWISSFFFHSKFHVTTSDITSNRRLKLASEFWQIRIREFHRIFNYVIIVTVQSMDLRLYSIFRNIKK